MKRNQTLKRNTLRQTIASLGLFGTGLAVGAFLLAYLLAGDIYDYEDTASQDHLPEVDAIVCLGGGRGRITAAADLWQRYWDSAHQGTSVGKKVPILYFSGMGHQVNWGHLAKQVKKGVAQKIHPEDIIIEKESFNTDANARWLIKYAAERRWKKILLLTSSYHMKRAHYIFDHLLKMTESPIEIETLSVYQEPFDSKEWRSGPNGIRVTLMEYLKWVYYRAIWRSL